MPKYINQGSQTREIGCKCGFAVSGSVREANMKLKLHMKKCNFHGDVPVFNKNNAYKNGLLEIQNDNIRYHTVILKEKAKL